MKRTIACLTALVCLFCLLLPLPVRAETEKADPDMPVLSSETRIYPAYQAEITYYYNEAGQLVQEVWNDGGTTVDYLYSKDGALISAIEYSQTRTYWETHYRTNGSRYSHVEYSFYQDGRPASTETTLFDEHDNPIYWCDAAVDGRYFNDLTYTNEYDKQDRLIRQETRNPANDCLLHVDTWKYNRDGSYTLDYTEYNGDPNDNPVWIHEVRKYNADGQILSMKRDIMDTAKCKDTTTYTYDKQGNLLCEEWVQYDYFGSRDYTVWRYDYENTYENGLITGARSEFTEIRYTGGKAGKPEVSYDRTQSWTYDEQGNVTYYNDGTDKFLYIYIPLAYAIAP